MGCQLTKVLASKCRQGETGIQKMHSLRFRVQDLGFRGALWTVGQGKIGVQKYTV
jgi:hypothetical protein